MNSALATKIEANRKEFERLLKDSNYIDVRFNADNGGLMATHKGHKKNNPKDETYFGGLTPIDLEKECQYVLYKNGYNCILENENIKDANGKFVSSLDSTTNGIPMDIKSATKITDNYRNLLYEKNDQLAKYNQRTDVVNTGSVILYFHDATFYESQKVPLGVASLHKLLAIKNKTNYLTEIICVVSDGRVEKFRL